MILSFRPLPEPLPHWNGVHWERRSPFSASYTSTLELLNRELEHLRATDVFLQVVATDRDVRLDRQLRANAKVEHPGVILTIETSKQGTLVYETDEFGLLYWRGLMNEAWKQNLRAIALGLEALRKIDRYGIARQGQQYAGYRALGGGTPMPAVEMTWEQAVRVIDEFHDHDWDASLGADIRAGYRAAVKHAHPDVGGDPAEFQRITVARDLLLEHIGAPT